jgi:aspartyl-tRNA synthetase
VLAARVPISVVAKSAIPGKDYVIAGWVDAVRVHGRLVFVIVRDRTGSIQVVAKKNISEEAWKAARELSPESVVVVLGTLVESKAAPLGREILAKKVEVLSEADPLPIEVKDYTKTVLAKRLDWRYLDLRHPRNLAIFLIEAEMARAAREWFYENGFVEIFTPKIVGSATEGGAEVFSIVYFEKPAFLAQSPQLYKQMGVIAGFERVFEIGPAFRAEPHHTTRHLTEYTSVDFEMGFIENFKDVARTAFNVIRYMIEEALTRYKDIINEYFPEALENVPREPFWIDIGEAYKLLRSEGVNVEEGGDLSSEAERKLGEIVQREYGNPFTIVTGYPWSVRPFYTMRDPEDPKYTLSFDILLRGLEVATGGQREHRYDVLIEQVREKGLNPQNFRWYLDMFRFGAPPHGGAGIGLERVVMQTLGLPNIREARLLPRDPERLVP